MLKYIAIITAALLLSLTNTNAAPSPYTGIVVSGNGAPSALVTTATTGGGRVTYVVNYPPTARFYFDANSSAMYTLFAGVWTPMTTTAGAVATPLASGTASFAAPVAGNIVYSGTTLMFYTGSAWITK